MNLHSHIDDVPSHAVRPGSEPALPAVMPEVTIDPKTGLPTALNPAAASFFGVAEGDVGAIPLCMPAWDAIRDFVDAKPGAASLSQPLLFWTPLGPLIQPAEISLALEGPRQSVRLRIAAKVSPPAAEPEAIQPPRPNSDTDTLREIARRIRAGTAGERPAPTRAPDREPPPALDFRPVMSSAPPPETSASAAFPREGLAKFVHELRTPLSAIASLAEVMRDERLGAMGNDRYKSYAADIFDSAQHTLELLTAAMETAEDAIGAPDRLELPVLQPMRFAPTDMDDLVRSCVSSMRPIAARGGVRIEQIAGNVPLVKADKRAVRQMLLNILSNAIRYTPSDGKITVLSVRAATGAVVISVADTGSGMRSADLVRALSRDSPHPVRPTTPRIRIAGGHHGIGLPLVRDMIEAHDGQFEIESIPGSGTRVSLTFPPARVVEP